MSETDLASEMEQAFHTGRVASLPPEKWEEFLAYLCAHSPSRVGGVLDPREINRGLLLSTLKNFDFINRIESSNKKWTLATIALSILALVVSGYSIYSSSSQSQDLSALLAAQDKQLNSLGSIGETQKMQLKIFSELLEETKRQSSQKRQ